MFAVGTYYPPESLLSDLPKEYIIRPDKLVTVANQLVGKPVTYEHLGVHGAASLLLNKTKFLSHTNTYKQSLDALSVYSSKLVLPIGKVCATWQGCDGGWRCLMHLNEQLDLVYSLIRAGVCSGLSLTHINEDIPAVVDVTLCAQPARQGCLIEYTSSCHVDAIMYKVRSMMGTNSTMEVSTPTQRSALELALDSIDGESRNLIVARFEELVNFCDAAKKDVAESKTSLAQANDKFAQYQNSKQQDTQMLAYQFQQVLNRLPSEVLESHTINKDLINSMTSANEHIRMNSTSRLLQACNQQMMQASHSKRPKLVEFAKPATQVASPVVTPMAETTSSSPDDLLRRALRESFEQ